MKTINKGLVHLHSENSRYDSPAKIKDIILKAKELGYKNISLTDHGTLSGMDEFFMTAKENGINGIPGVELYIKDENISPKRMHLILFAKNDIGYKYIGKIVTESNKNIENGFPITTKEMLEKFIKEGGYGNIYATSACMLGVLGSILLSPIDYKNKISKLEEKRNKLKSSESNLYIESKKTLEFMNFKINKLKEEKEVLLKLSKKSFKKKENQINKLKEKGEDYKELEEALNLEKKESQDAMLKLVEVKEQIGICDKQNNLNKKLIKSYEEEIEKNEELQKEIENIKKKIPNEENLKELVCKEANYYRDLFGKDNFFIEIQFHNYKEVLEDGKEIEIEKEIMITLSKIANELNIGMTVANDSHVVNNEESEFRKRYILNCLRYNNLVDKSESDKELYIKSEEELKKMLSNILNEDELCKAFENTYEILDNCKLDYNFGSHFPKYQDLKEGESSSDKLRQLAYENILKKFNKNEFTKEYEDRLKYELDIICDMGYADYFLIVKDFLAVARDLGKLSDSSLNELREKVKELNLEEMLNFIEERKEKMSFSVGAGRGSAAGSLVAYLIGITDIVDPLKYDLLFERFLNKDRVSMPDVDSDISPEVRDLTIEYCKKRYGVETVANIMTKAYIKPRGAIRNVARILGLENNAKDYYLILADKISKKIPEKPGTSFATIIDEENNVNVKDFLLKEFSGDENAIQIIEEASLIEGIFLNYGMHAAGVIIADGYSIDNYVPLMKDDKSGDMKVQCDMVQAEEIHGLLKFDFLGLRNLNIVTLTLRSIKKRFGKEIDVTKLPFEKEVFESIFAKGNTGSVFQFESNGMKAMLKQAKPNSFEDIIALVSLYRPGPMDFIPKWIEGKHNPKSIEYDCEELKPILSVTYGCIVYQEQVMRIFTDLAGYSLSAADNVRRFMSKKKADKLAKEKTAFIYGDEERKINGCIKNGIKKEVAEKIFEYMYAFSAYAFNKSHAASYSALSYITAYLKYHYPADYFCAVLNTTKDLDKIRNIINDANDNGVRILQPNINLSKNKFIVSDNNQILFGLNSVKGTKEKTIDNIVEYRKKHSKITNYKEFLKLGILDKATAEALIKAGAFDEFYNNRKSLLNMYYDTKDLFVDLNKTNEKLNLLNPETDTKKYENAKAKIEVLNKKINIINFIDYTENKKERLKEEKSVLGLFVSDSLLNDYSVEQLSHFKRISDIDINDKFVKVFGIIQDLEMKRTKTNKEMAIFNLEDKSGSIKVCCFTKAYESLLSKNEYPLEEDNCISLSGKVMVDSYDNENDDANEIKFTLSLEDCDIIYPDKEEIILIIDDISMEEELLNKLESHKYFKKGGHKLMLFDKLNSEIRETKYYVDERVKDDPDFM